MTLYTTETDAALAIDGGPKVRTEPMPVRKLFGDEELRAVTELMTRARDDGSHLMGYGGAQEDVYCRRFSEQMGGGFTDAVNSGTNAVYVALAALELEPGSEVVVPPISDPGGVMPVSMLGCLPIAADSEPGSLNISAKQIERVITPRTKAILVAHLAGLPVDMDPVLALAKTHDLAVVEDCAQAHGAKYRGRPVGSLGDIAAFSTMFGKHHASGGQGGLVFTQREDLYWSARRWADRGKPFGIEEQAENVRCSLNCNMDELHAAIGHANLGKLPAFVAARRRVVERMARGCESLEAASIVTERAGDEASYWFVLVRLELDRLTVDRAAFAQAVTAEGVDCAAGYPFFPVTMDWARWRHAATPGWSVPELPNARAAEAQHCRIVIHEGWTAPDADDAVAAITKVHRACLRN